MLRMIVGLLMLASIIPVCRADDLTDAITNADPRSRLQSGTGAVLGAVLGPKDTDAENAPAEEEDLNQFPTLPAYGLSSKDLHDPMGTADDDNAGHSSDSQENGGALGGFSNHEPGVNYQNSSSDY